MFLLVSILSLSCKALMFVPSLQKDFASQSLWRKAGLRPAPKHTLVRLVL